MERLITLLLGLAFLAGGTTVFLAQGRTTTGPKEERRVDKPASEPKKPAVHSARGTVKAATDASLVVAGKAKGGKDAEWTFTVDPKTKIRKGGKDIVVSDLAAGDPVVVRHHDEGGRHVVDSVMVRTVKKPVAETPKTEAPKKGETKK